MPGESTPTQKERLLEITTPLGPDVLLLRQMSGHMELSRPFQFDLELLSTNHAIKFSDIVGQNVTVKVMLADGSKRCLNGHISRFVQTGAKGPRYGEYQATMVPWLWFLTRTSDCRIFQSMKAPDIIKQVLKDKGFSDIEDRLEPGNYRTWEYCVQYRETDFNFVSRLMEQEGIYYYFMHADGKHTLVLCDSLSKHDTFPAYEEIHFQRADEKNEKDERISDWTVAQSVEPGAYMHNDYNFSKPLTPLRSQSSLPGEHDRANYEIFDYPGEFTENSEGDQYARVRMEELHAPHEVVGGMSDVRGMMPGYRFALADHPRDDQNREYLITSVHYEASAAEFESGGEDDEFSCRFTAIPSAIQFRPARITPKPLIQGAQTAVVVGPSGDEIYTDKYARVKVHFFWDRHDKSNEKSSCWIRVAQAWAGKKWGAIWIPRIGQEVVVEFLEGDPDHPLITCRVYNDDQMPPYELPANKTQAGLKSRSSKGGSDANFNEIRFEDKKGSEQVLIHAEKNQDNVVENDETTKVGHDRTENVGHDETIGIGNNRTENVGKDESIFIGNNRTENVEKNEKISIGENRNTDVGKNEDVTVGQDRTESVGKNETITIGENREEKVGKDEKLEVAGNREEQIGKDDKIQVGKKYAMVVGDEILLQTGDASITMKKDGTIQIKGKDITVVGSGKIGVKASSDLTLKGSKIAEN